MNKLLSFSLRYWLNSTEWFSSHWMLYGTLNFKLIPIKFPITDRLANSQPLYLSIFWIANLFITIVNRIREYLKTIIISNRHYEKWFGSIRTTVWVFGKLNWILSKLLLRVLQLNHGKTFKSWVLDNITGVIAL